MTAPRDAAAWADAVRHGTRADLARAITLVESTRPDHQALAQELLAVLLPESGRSIRVGFTGVPGVGKSTLLDELGTRLTAAGHRVAVLAVDPSSPRTGGSVLGDKTRMARLAHDPAAYVRPSPTSGTLGGVARATRETIVLLEAAGFDVVLVETVGVGQSETAVCEMVDCFCFLTMARTGDQLQGMKKGVLELADVVAVNKADGEHKREAERAARDLRSTMRLLHPTGRVPPVLAISALEGHGVDELWAEIERYRDAQVSSGDFDARRRRQQVDWTWSIVRDRLLERLTASDAVRAIRAEVEDALRSGEITSTAAADRILTAFDTAPDTPNTPR